MGRHVRAHLWLVCKHPVAGAGFVNPADPVIPARADEFVRLATARENASPHSPRQESFKLWDLLRPFKCSIHRRWHTFCAPLPFVPSFLPPYSATSPLPSRSLCCMVFQTTRNIPFHKTGAVFILFKGFDYNRWIKSIDIICADCCVFLTTFFCSRKGGSERCFHCVLFPFNIAKEIYANTSRRVTLLVYSQTGIENLFEYDA